MVISYGSVSKLVLRLAAACFLLSLVHQYLSRQAPTGERRNAAVERVEHLRNLASELVKETQALGKLRGRLDRALWPISVKNGSTRVLPVLVMACDRVTVRRCLDKLVQYRPNVETFPIIVSQDCRHAATYEAILEYVTPASGVSVVLQPDPSRIPLERSLEVDRAYYNIARHYKFALSHVLEDMAHDNVIIVEDDLDVAEDFYEYFFATLPVLEKDHSLWCISAWNDNGKEGLIDPSRPELLHRTDFFPGLGWLLPARVWRQIKPNWPKAYFDDWLRNLNHVGNRSCIRPEISRTKTFGEDGVSKGRYFDSHLRHIRLSDQYVPFSRLDLSYLRKGMYDERLAKQVAAATSLSVRQAARGAGDPRRSAKVLYTSCVLLRKAMRALLLMDDVWFGVPRTAYRGVVSCYYGGRRVYITPRNGFTKYNPLCE